MSSSTSNGDDPDSMFGDFPGTDPTLESTPVPDDIPPDDEYDDFGDWTSNPDDVPPDDVYDIFGDWNIGNPVGPCPKDNGNPFQSWLLGILDVTVVDAVTGDPIVDASVTSIGLDPRAGTTDEMGNITWTEVLPGPYGILASRGDYTTETAQATVPAGGIATVLIPLNPITVTLALAQPVACPGHPLDITAVGSPSGGLYSWNISGDGVDLIDTSGNSTRSGSKVRLRGFQTGVAGNIPALSAEISVTYTYTNASTATAAQTVSVHGIEFIVTNRAITHSRIEVMETFADVYMCNPEGTPTVSASPTVQIRLEASCPRKDHCAFNHRAGWLQVMATNFRQARYTHSSVNIEVPVPIRDRWYGEHPFYANALHFVADTDKKPIPYEDSPNGAFNWLDNRKEAPVQPPAKNRKLREVHFANSFTSWLVVQNVDYASHNLADSFAFLGHFDWSVEIHTTVDLSMPRGQAVSPKQSPAVAPDEILAGKGDKSPIFDTTYPASTVKVVTRAEPEI